MTQVDVVESTSPLTLEGKVAASFAAQLLAHPVSQLVDIYVAGGGAGGVFQATILYSTVEATHFPPLVDQNVKVFQAPDPQTEKTKIAAFLALPTTDRITFADKVAAGAGALWVDLLVYTRVVLLLDAELALRGDAPLAGNTRPGDLSGETSLDAHRARKPRRLRKG